jgi:type IV secretion system protein TrbL
VMLFRVGVIGLVWLSCLSTASAVQLGGLLAGHEADFEAAGAANGIDPKFLEAIAIEETGNGTSNALAQHNNPAGLMDPSTPNDTGFFNFPTITDGINAEAATLQRGYIGQGLTTISAIGQKYAPAGALNDPNGTNANWANDVAGFYQQLGGTSMAMGTAIPGGNGMPGGANFTHAATPAFVDQWLQKFASAGKGWSGVILRAATSLFWILAGISCSWTLIMLVLKRADLLEICVELVRFIMSTGFFFWILTNAADFAQKIVASLWMLGGQAAGTGNAIYPGDLITLGMKVLMNSSGQLTWVMVSPAAGIPFVLALIILIICALIAVNMIFLLSASWVVLYAGIIFLGFGGCRWTSDMAVNYYRTILGIGISLMVMELVIGIGQKFLEDMVASSGANPDIPGMATIMVATIIVAVLSHRLPSMVSQIAVGSGHHGAIGGIGLLTAMGTALAVSSFFARFAGGSAGTAGAGGMSAAQQITERINAAVGIAGNGNGSPAPISNGSPPSRMNAAAPSSGSPRQGPSSTPPPVPQAASQAHAVQAIVAEDPPESRPTSPDEARGFEREPVDFGVPEEDEPL